MMVEAIPLLVMLVKDFFLFLGVSNVFGTSTEIGGLV